MLGCGFMARHIFERPVAYLMGGGVDLSGSGHCRLAEGRIEQGAEGAILPAGPFDLHR